MKDLNNRLSILKMILNSSKYGVDFSTVNNVYAESYKIRIKIKTIKSRKDKINRIFNV
jgi:hypothetical protein